MKANNIQIGGINMIKTSYYLIKAFTIMVLKGLADFDTDYRNLM